MTRTALPSTADLGALLRLFRRRAGVTQEALAEAAGLSAAGIRLLEAGRRKHPRPTTIDQLAAALELPAADRKLLKAAARRNTAAAPDEAPRQLPAGIADFTGRATQLDELVGILREPYAVAPGVLVAAISGMGGVGKTTLAIQASHSVVDEYPDGQLYLNLRGGGTDPLSTTEALQSLLRSLGIPPTGAADVQLLAGRYRTAMAGRRILVLLDDASSVRQVLPLLPGSPGSAVVVTSRKRLSALPGAQQINLDVLAEDEAVQLLGEVVGPSLISAEPDVARILVRRCGLLPLAVRIAGGQARRSTAGLKELAVQLTDASGRLDALTGQGAAVNTSIALSLTTLASGDSTDAAAAEAFGTVASFDGGWFPLRAAAKVLARSVNETEALLERLVDVHLLETPALHQYRFHDLVRDIGRALPQSLTPAAAFQRELECYRGMLWRYIELGRRDDLYRSFVEPSWSADAKELDNRDKLLEWLESEIHNLVRLIRAAAAGSADQQVTAVQLALGMSTLAIALMRFGEAYQALAAVMTEPVELDLRLDQGRHYQMAFVAGIIDRHDECVRWGERGLELARALGEPHQLAASLINHGQVLGISGLLAESLVLAEEALRVVEDNGVHPHEVGANVGVGIAAGLVGDLDRQRSAFARAIQLMDQDTDGPAWAAQRTMIGESLRQSGQHEAALEMLTDAHARARASNHDLTEVWALEQLGLTWLAVGDHAKAQDVLAAGAAIASRHPGEHREAPMRQILGQALAGLGRPDEARAEWQSALVLYERTADPRAGEVRELLVGQR